jgi:hypothetical protein
MKPHIRYESGQWVAKTELITYVTSDVKKFEFFSPHVETQIKRAVGRTLKELAIFWVWA